MFFAVLQFSTGGPITVAGVPVVPNTPITGRLPVGRKLQAVSDLLTHRRLLSHKILDQASYWSFPSADLVRILLRANLDAMIAPK